MQQWWNRVSKQIFRFIIWDIRDFGKWLSETPYGWSSIDVAFEVVLFSPKSVNIAKNLITLKYWGFSL